MDQVAASSLSYSLCMWLSMAVWCGSWQDAGESIGWSKAICLFIAWAYLGEPNAPLSSLEPVPLGKGAREMSIPCLLALRFAANRCILWALCGGDQDSVFHWSHSLKDPWFRAILLLTEWGAAHLYVQITRTSAFLCNFCHLHALPFPLFELRKCFAFCFQSLPFFEVRVLVMEEC